MDCKEVCDKMYDYVEHQLSQQEIIKFEEHMKDCKHCQDEYYKLEKLIVKLKNIKDIEPPTNLKYKILDNIKNQTQQQNKKAKIIYFKKYSYVAATMIFFIGGFYILKAIENSPIKNQVYNTTKIENYITTQDVKQTTNIDIYTETTSQQIETPEDNNKINIEDTTENLTSNIEQTITSEQQTQVESKTMIEQTPSNAPRIASQEPTKDLKTQEVEIFNNSRALQANVGENYLYEKTLSKDDNIENFKYDIPLYKNQICNVYFENNSDENITLFVENIDGQKVSNDTIVEKNSNNNMQFYMTEGELEQDVYTINVKALDKNVIEGYLKIEILPKE